MENEDHENFVEEHVACPVFKALRLPVGAAALCIDIEALREVEHHVGEERRRAPKHDGSAANLPKQRDYYGCNQDHEAYHEALTHPQSIRAQPQPLDDHYDYQWHLQREKNDGVRDEVAVCGNAEAVNGKEDQGIQDGTEGPGKTEADNGAHSANDWKEEAAGLPGLVVLCFLDKQLANARVPRIAQSSYSHSTDSRITHSGVQCGRLLHLVLE